jgi:predicted RNase H-like nuclease
MQGGDDVNGTDESVEAPRPGDAAPVTEQVGLATGRTAPIRAVGVDSCQGGWVAVWSADGRLNARVHKALADLVAAYPHVACVAVDLPIGLTAAGARACDKAARALLGAPRNSSVVPAPDPRLLTVPDFATATARSLALTQKGVSRQVFASFPKVAELDDLVTPLLQNWVVEAHAEVSLWAMAGGSATAHAKSVPEGFEERRDLLARELGIRMPATKLESRDLVPKAAPDEVLDAAAALWTAHRVVDGLAERLPLEPTPEHDVDRRGRRMEIVY